MGHKRHRAGPKVIPGQIQLGGEIGDPQAIGSHQDRASLATARGSGLLQREARSITLAQAGRDRDDGASAGRQGIVDRGFEAGGANGDDDELRGFR